MKARIFLFAVSISIWAQTSQNQALADTAKIESPVPGITFRETYPGMPRVEYSKLPWLQHPQGPRQSEIGADLEQLVANLKEDVNSTVTRVAGLNESLVNMTAQQYAIVTGNLVPLAANLSTLMSRNISTLVSQDLSVLNSQLLSSTLAVPTSLPWPSWGNGPSAVAIGTPGSEVVLTTYPSRTAWGNGPGVVVTSPGGAVATMVPAYQATSALAETAVLQDINRQLLTVQNDVERLESVLENVNTGTNRIATPPTYQQPYLTPTGR